MQREIGTDKQKENEIERQTNRERERETDRQTDRQRKREKICRQTDRLLFKTNTTEMWLFVIKINQIGGGGGVERERN